MGKSAILSAWLARREATATVPHHLIRRQVADWDQPEVIAVSLAAQIEAAFPDLVDADTQPQRRLINVLTRVSKRLGSARSLVVLVDGLDETRAELGDNPLPRFLPQVMPAGIRFLCATRPMYPHLNWLEARSPVRWLDLDDPRWAASNEAVVRGFWEARGSEYQPPLSCEAITTAIARAEGNVLHAVMLHDALRDLPAAERRIGGTPRGLKALIGEIWDTVASHAAVRAGLGFLAAAREALSLDVLAELSAGWRVRRIKGLGHLEVVYSREGVPLILPIDAEIDDLRHAARGEGRFRLDPVDEHNRMIPQVPAGYVCVQPSGTASELAPLVSRAPTDNVAIEAMRMTPNRAPAGQSLRHAAPRRCGRGGGSGRPAPADRG